MAELKGCSVRKDLLLELADATIEQVETQHAFDSAHLGSVKPFPNRKAAEDRLAAAKERTANIRAKILDHDEQRCPQCIALRRGV